LCACVDVQCVMYINLNIKKNIVNMKRESEKISCEREKMKSRSWFFSVCLLRTLSSSGWCCTKKKISTSSWEWIFNSSNNNDTICMNERVRENICTHILVRVYSFFFARATLKKLEFKIFARQNFHVSVFNEIKNVNFDKCSLSILANVLFVCDW
jgi:hypothetical protein